MKISSKNVVLASLLAAASCGAFAANTVDMQVIGTITPQACTPTFSGGGIIDFGTIPAASLSATDFTTLTDKTTTLTIACDGATRVAVKATDDRSGTAAAGAAVDGATYAYGLGNVGSKSVGAYELAMGAGQALGDGVNVARLASGNGTTWGAFSNEQPAHFTSDGVRMISWAPTGVSTPRAYTTISQQVTVKARLAKKADLPDLTQDVPLDGLTTFSLVYL